MGVVEGFGVGMKRRNHDGDSVQERVKEVLELVMEWLSPQELATLARASQTMAKAVERLTQARVADAAQGMERWPVPVRNDLDSCRYPWFRYTPSCFLPTSEFHRWGNDPPEQHRYSFMRQCQEQLGIFASSGILDSVGCRCADNCVLAQQNDATDCSCGRTIDGLNAYTPDAKLQLLYQYEETVNLSSEIIDTAEELDEEPLEDSDSDGSEGPPLIMECGGACGCNGDCSHRLTQQGLSVRAVVMRQKRTGWSLHAAQRISKGSFVCEYAGELLTTLQSRERQRQYDNDREKKGGSALLVLREFMPSGNSCIRLNVDATRVGNVARFINHACDGGNLLPCLVRAAGSVIPRLVLFARREILEGEEMRYSYGSCGGVAGKVLPCYCGTAACFGTLPSDTT